MSTAEAEITDLSGLQSLRVGGARILGLGHDVFLSHSHEDGASYAEALHDALASHDRQRLSSYLDKKRLRHGDSLSAGLTRALHRSTVLVVVGTASAWTSQWVSREISTYLASHRAAPRVLWIQFPNAPVPKQHRHFDLLDDTLAIPATAEGPVAAAEAIRSYFKFARKRRIRTVAIGLLVVLSSALTWSAVDTNRERRASLWNDRAGTAESELRFAEGELMFARAFEIAGRDEDARGYRRCRDRRDLEHAVRIDLDADDETLAVVAGADGPHLVVRDAAAGRLNLRSSDGTLTLYEGDTESAEAATVAAGHGWFALRIGRTLLLHEVTATASAATRRLTLPADVVDIAVYPSHAAWLVRGEHAFVIDGAPRQPGDPIDPVEFEHQGTTTTTAALLDDRPGILLAGDVALGGGGGYAPYAFVWREDLTEAWQQPFARRSTSLPQTFDGSSSAAGGVVCLGLSPPNSASLITGLKDNRDRVSYVYARLDDGFFRDFEVERVSLRAELFDTGGVDLYYRTESRELRCVRTPDLVVAAIRRETLTTDIEDFTRWPTPDQACVVFIRDDAVLGCVEGGSIQSLRPTRIGASEVLSSRDGRFLAVIDENSASILQRAEPTRANDVPPVEVIERELGLKLPSE